MKHSDTSILKLLARRPSGYFDPLARYGLILMLSNKGQVSRIIHEGPAHNLQRRFLTLQDQDIRDYFGLPESKSVKTLATTISDTDPEADFRKAFAAAKRLPSKNRFEKYDFFYEFHTALPFSHLYLCDFPGYGIVGIVMITTLGRRAEYLTYLSANPFVLLDGQGRIQCVNSSFARHFLPAVDQPSGFLGKPCTDFLSANPIDLLAGPEKTTGKVSWMLEKECAPGAWAPDPDQFNLLPLEPAVDTTALWLKIKMVIESSDTGLPFVLINGGRFTGEYIPDYCGYLIGYDPEANAVRVKKRAETVFEQAVPEIEPTWPLTVEVERLGPVFKYSLNGQVIMVFHDPDPLEDKTACQYLYARKPGTITISRAGLYTTPERPGLIPPLSRITFLNRKDNTFELRQLIDRMTLVNNCLYYGFMFYDVSTLVTERNRFEAIARQRDFGEESIIGNHPSLATVKEKARVAGAASVTVLIEGETGTGKELLARYIHKHSPMSDGPFIKVDCATLPQNLLESELFGYEKGAFTGATDTRVGRLEAAHNGTLFLDEIGNLDMTTQAKLLNFLQDFELVRLGSNKRIKVETRIVTALNRPLKTLVDEGAFREDLYYRLNIVSLQIPPLRNRRDDIPLLCRYFLDTFNKKLKRRIRDFTPDSYQKLVEHGWPGNIRELENAVQKAVLFCEEDRIGPDLIELSAGMTRESASAIPAGVARALKKDHIIELLKRNKGIVAWAAKEARIGRATFYRKMRKFNIDPENLP